jgi:hypothetical protein
MKERALNVFGTGNADLKGVYFDEENRRHLNTIRSAYAELAIDLASKGRKAEAVQVLEKVDKMMDQENFPYGMTSRGNMHNRNSLMFLEACYMADAKALIQKVSASVKKDLQQQLKYYNSLTGIKAEMMDDEKRMTESYIEGMDRMSTIYNPAITIPGKLMAPKDSGK